MNKDPLLSVVFITYKRVDLLEKSLRAFMSHCNYNPIEFIVADDGSSANEQIKIRTLPFDKYILSPKNKGLGANQNAGLNNASGKYILMLQDDWELTDCSGIIQQAISILEHDSEIGIINLCTDPSRLPLIERQIIGDLKKYWVCDHHSDAYKLSDFYVYSDTPHLRRAILNQPSVLGLYREDRSMEETERDYELRFDHQSEFKIAFLTPYCPSFFNNLGVAQSFREKKLRYKLDNYLLILVRFLRLNKNSQIYKILRSIWYNLKYAMIYLRILK